MFSPDPNPKLEPEAPYTILYLGYCPHPVTVYIHLGRYLTILSIQLNCYRVGAVPNLYHTSSSIVPQATVANHFSSRLPARALNPGRQLQDLRVLESFSAKLLRVGLGFSTPPPPPPKEPYSALRSLTETLGVGTFTSMVVSSLTTSGFSAVGPLLGPTSRTIL